MGKSKFKELQETQKQSKLKRMSQITNFEMLLLPLKVISRKAIHIWGKFKFPTNFFDKDFAVIPGELTSKQSVHWKYF